MDPRVWTPEFLRDEEIDEILAAYDTLINKYQLYRPLEHRTIREKLLAEKTRRTLSSFVI